MSTNFKKGDRIIFVEDDNYESVEMPKGTRGTYDDDSPTTGVPYVLLDTGERVPAWRERIAHGFKKGDKVTVREGAVSLFGHTRDPKEVRTVRGPARSAANAVTLEPIPGTGGGNTFFASDLVPYVETAAPLDPSKVKPGDTVTLRVDPPDTHPAFTVAGETHSLGGSSVYVGGWRVDDLPNYVTLTDHQPAPEPVTGHGTAYVFGMVAHGIPQRRYHGFLLADGGFKFMDDRGWLRIATPDEYDAFEPEPKPE